ncbi:MFS transporter [Paludibaculum fermentans]|uniref:MFS transporter n=1 Tax=Paludibaculum fermentans TaxID=1473598 RepID=A0A7S7NVI7_PALFE|nr:MFS transporter [Paludibaculum fermentans]QOY90506.1 MFS transporter [Paludibaculum fermentans]
MSESRMSGEGSAGYPGWRVVFASSVGVLTGFASLLVYTFGIFLKPLSAEFGWSREAVSMAFGFAALTVAVCSPVLGRLLDRYGPRRVIVPCVTVFALAFGALSLLSSHLWHLYAMFVLIGAVGNGTAMLSYARAISSWFDQRRGLALALMLTGGTVGAVAWPPAAQALILHFGWRWAFAVLGGLVLLVGLPTVATMVRENPASRKPSGDAQTGVEWAEGLKSRAFWILAVVLFLASISQNGTITHLPALLTDRGVDSSRAALAVSAMGVAAFLGRMITGWLLDRFPAPRVGFVLLALAAGGVFVMASARTLETGIVAAVLIGFGMGGEADVTPFLLSRYFGLRSFSTLYGLTWTSYAIAGAIGPILMGRAFDSSSSYGGMIVKLAVLTVGAAALMLFLPALPESRAKQPETRLPGPLLTAEEPVPPVG